jgi:SAM-dependent methyltransferase
VIEAEERLRNDPMSELWGEHRARYRFAAQLATGRRVLDVACGSGFGLHMLRDAGARPIGIDLDSPALAEARGLDAGSRLVRADATRLPLSDGCVELVTSFETIEHVADAAALVRELRRVLRPGGLLVVSTPNRDFGPPARHAANPFHVQEFAAAELRELVRTCFTDVRLYGQWPTEAYHYVPFLMLESDWTPRALVWKASNRLPFALKNRLARLVSGKPFYPGDDDYVFVPDKTDGAHALLAVASAGWSS